MKCRDILVLIQFRQVPCHIILVQPSTHVNIRYVISDVSRRFSDWGSPSGYNGYSVTGYGTLDDKYSAYYSGGGGYGGYDSVGYSGYPGYSGNAGFAGNGYSGSPGYAGSSGYAGNAGYGGYKGYGGGYGLNSGSGSGYGGYGGNGGLNSYYGYNNPNYQGAYHLGYGYNKRPGYGNIYSSGVTPSLVTGYRGYSRR